MEATIVYWVKCWSRGFFCGEEFNANSRSTVAILVDNHRHGEDNCCGRSVSIRVAWFACMESKDGLYSLSFHCNRFHGLSR